LGATARVFDRRTPVNSFEWQPLPMPQNATDWLLFEANSTKCPEYHSTSFHSDLVPHPRASWNSPGRFPRNPTMKWHQESIEQMIGHQCDRCKGAFRLARFASFGDRETAGISQAEPSILFLREFFRNWLIPAVI
jgi:hypothetical protein